MKRKPPLKNAAEPEMGTEIQGPVMVLKTARAQEYGATDSTGLLHDVATTPLALIPAGELNQAETDALLFMWEEEKLARDVYTAFSTI